MTSSTPTSTVTPITLDQAMTHALRLATWAQRQHGEVPVAAVLLYQHKIIAAAANACVRGNNLLLHAEMRVLQRGLRYCNRPHLADCTLVVTLEPCLLCVGALLRTRIQHVVFGAYCRRYGAFRQEWLPKPQPLLTCGVKAQACAKLLRRFFHQQRRLREQKR